MSAWPGLLAVAFLTSCASASPTPTASATAPESQRAPLGMTDARARIPTVTIGGVPGEVFSWCWETVCADGEPPADAPVLPGGREIAVSDQAEDVQASVSDARFARSAAVQLDANALGPIPAGDWTYVVLWVRYGTGRDAYYAWTLGK